MASTSVQTMVHDRVSLPKIEKLSTEKLSTIEEFSSLDAKCLEKSSEILEIIFKYRMTKNGVSMDRIREGTPMFLETIYNFVKDNKTVRMCLPAFPFKSANKVVKVLGDAPDYAEEVSISRLNNLCSDIAEVYEPGAKLVIISDGLVYNDLLAIPDREVWSYGQQLEAMVAEKGFNHIEFSRLKDLVDFPLPEKLDEITYVANATNFRRALLNTFGKPDLDIDHEIATQEDTLLTYRGYKRFLESDLKQIFPLGEGRSNRQYKNDVSFLAKQMLMRGYAFSGAVKAAYGDHVRLSIHQSTGQNKISIGLLPTGMTPWHCCVGVKADGTVISGTRIDFEEDPNFEVLVEDEKPIGFKEKGSGEKSSEEED